jgi:hypothetical protein
MVGDDRQDAARAQGLPHGREGTLQLRQFVIHLDAYRLKQAGKYGRARPRAESSPDRVDEIVARGKGLPCATSHDLPGQATRPRLVTVVPEHTAEFTLGTLVEHVRGRAGLVTTHTHIKGRSSPKGEAPLILVELLGRNSEIKEG